MALFILFPIKNKPIKSVECFLYAGQGESKIQSYMAGTVEGSAVLPDNAHLDSRLLQIVYGHAMTAAPLRAVYKQHIRALGLRIGNTLEMLVYISAGIVHILGKS